MTASTASTVSEPAGNLPHQGRLALMGALFGAGFGFVLGAARLHEYQTIHAMLRFDELDVYFLMASAIGTSMPLLWILERRRVRSLYAGVLALSRSRPQRHHVVGGALFGAGWAVAGTCPAPALVMVSSGAGLGLVATAGLFVGMILRGRQAATTLAGDGEHRILAHRPGAAAPVEAGLSAALGSGLGTPIA